MPEAITPTLNHGGADTGGPDIVPRCQLAHWSCIHGMPYVDPEAPADSGLGWRIELAIVLAITAIGSGLMLLVGWTA
jgi:hypothetical protein